MDTFIKDPDAVLDYKIDWSAFLGDDRIFASTWSAGPEGISIDSNEYSYAETVVWLSGGTLGTSYIVTNHITTAGGREEDRSIKIKIMHK